MKHRIFSALTALCLISCTAAALPALPARALDAGGLTYEVQEDDTVIIKRLPRSTTIKDLTIPDTIDGYPVTAIGQDAFSYCTALRTVTIPESVTSIGKYAFQGCTSLSGVNIPEGVTVLKTAVFYRCTSLRTLTIPESVTSIGASAFSRSSLSSVTVIPESVTCIGEFAFYETPYLTARQEEDPLVVVGNGILVDGTACTGDVIIPEDVTQIAGYAFYGSTLTGVSFGGGVEGIGRDAFKDCKSLRCVTIPENVTSIGGEAFFGCDSLRILTVLSPDCSIEGVIVDGEETFHGEYAYYGFDENGAPLDRYWYTYHFPGVLYGHAGSTLEAYVKEREAAHNAFDPDHGYYDYETPAFTAIEDLGDVNADGEKDVLDLVNLQKRLVRAHGTVYYSNGRYDLNMDGRFDVCDLTLLRRLLVQRTEVGGAV